jgi:hypothetical protein
VDGEPLVKVGQWVEAEDPLLSMSTFPGRVLHEDVARELRVAPAQTERCLIPPPGTMIKVGDKIARSSMFWHHRIARAAHEGSIAGVSPSLGVVYMREHLPTQLAETVRIDIVGELRGDKNNFHSYLRVREGDQVEKGQVLATRQEGAKFHNVISPVFGTVTTVVPLMGSMTIIPDKVSSVLTAHVSGRVTAIHGGREVELLAYGVAVEGLLGIGGEARGLVAAAPNDASPWRAASQPGAGLSGRILVAGMVDRQSLAEAAKHGVTGVIAGYAHQAQVSLFLGRELGVVATGDEDVSPVLILTEGFGAGRMDPGLYAKLARLEGMLASLNGTTHIRAGVIRPRAVVSFPAPEGVKRPGDRRPAEVTEAQARGRAGGGEILTGARVRVLRGPWAGRTGTVESLPGIAQEIPTGAKVLVAGLCLEPESPGALPARVTVPQANIKVEV